MTGFGTSAESEQETVGEFKKTIQELRLVEEEVGEGRAGSMGQAKGDAEGPVLDSLKAFHVGRGDGADDRRCVGENGQDVGPEECEDGLGRDAPILTTERPEKLGWSQGSGFGELDVAFEGQALVEGDSKEVGSSGDGQLLSIVVEGMEQEVIAECRGKRKGDDLGLGWIDEHSPENAESADIVEETLETGAE